MNTLARIRSRLSVIYMVSSCISLFMSPSVDAAGISIHYGNQHYGASIGHHQGHAALGNIKPRHHAHHNYSAQYRYDYNNHHYRHYSYPRYSTYSSPASRYYSQQYTPGYFDSRFPNTYRSRSYNYYQGTQSRSYGNRYSNPINAWETLAQGQTNIALKQFGSEAQSYPKAGIPKIGYALASAASGDLKQGVVAMRRAFRLDPVSLYNYQVDTRLHTMLNQLIAKYQYSLNHRGRHKDEAFMVAALSYLNNDYTAAHEALERAKKDGDRSRSVKNLRDILKETHNSTRHANNQKY